MGNHLHDAHALAGFEAGSSWAALVLIAMLIGAAAIYGRGWSRVRRMVPEIRSPWRPCSFIGGLVTVWAVLGSPLARLHHEYLLAHMMQHLLLSLCAAPLILLGAPRIPLQQGIPWRAARRRVLWLLRSAPIRALGWILKEPAVCWGAAMLVFVGWHLPSLFDLAWRSERWHLIECASFFASGLLFWWPVIEPWPSTSTWPRWSTPLYLFGATLPCDVLSAFLAFSDRVVYPAYGSTERHSQMAALHDQGAAGAVMWFCVTFAYGIPAATSVLRWLSPERTIRHPRNTAKV
jgi:cytochrome c oxidase assembly factor CtaG